MSPIVEIYLSGSTTNFGLLDQYPDEQINLIYKINDVTDIFSNSGNYSETFNIPGTRTNNILFNNIFEITIDSQFNQNKKAIVQILVDSIPVINGTLQLTNVEVDDQNNIMYEVVVYGNTNNFITSIDGLYVQDLDYSANNQLYSDDNITKSWTATTPSIYYPLVDYGYDLNIANMGGTGTTYNNFYPAIQAKIIVDNIFNQTGFTYTSNFLNSTFFKNLYVEYNGNTNLAQNPTFISSRHFFGTPALNTISQDTFPAIDFNNWGVFHPATIPAGSYFNNIIQAPTNGSYYNSGGLSYFSADTNMSMTLTANINYIFSASTNDTNIFTSIAKANRPYMTVEFYRTSYSPGPFYSQGHILYANGIVQDALFTTILGGVGNVTSSKFYAVQPGEQFFCLVNIPTLYVFTTSSTLEPVSVLFEVFSANTYFTNQISATLLPNKNNLNINGSVPQNLKQLDYLKSVFSMFNLQMQADPIIPNNFQIEPYDTFYSGGTILNWTKKLDINQTINEDLVANFQTKTIVLSYTDDQDWYNDNYKTITNRTYGDYYFNNLNDFTDAETNLKVVFSPIIMGEVIGTTDFIVPKMYKLDPTKNYGATNFNIRIGQRNNLPLNETWYYTYSGATRGSTNSKTNSYTTYPYFGNLDTPFASTKSLNFGSSIIEYYGITGETNHNLVNDYWINYLNAVTDHNSKIITAQFYLTPADVCNFDFRNIIYVEGITQSSGAYFRVNSINYSPTHNVTSEVTLTKLNSSVFNSYIVNPKIRTNSPAIGQFIGAHAMNGASVFSEGGIATGNGSAIASGGQNDIIIGANNTIMGSGNNAIIGGMGNTISPTTGNSVTNAVVLGIDNYSATTGNTTYVNNLQLVYSSSTINGVPIANILSAAGDLLWTAGTGTNSIIANNGTGNMATGTATLVGGQGNSGTSNNWQFIGGGKNNIVKGNYSSVGGGYANKNNSSLSFVGGGRSNLASGIYSNIVGGFQNSAITNYSSVVGGKTNLASGDTSFVGGGVSNQAIGVRSFVGAGSFNFAYGTRSFVGAGWHNSATTNHSSVIGGWINLASGNYSSVGGGYNNVASATQSFVGGGKINLASGYASFIGAGTGNTASGIMSSVVAGRGNVASATYSTISGGKKNTASGNFSIVGGGYNNVAYSTQSFVGGGLKNITKGSMSSVVGGYNNSATTNYSFVGGGYENIASGGIAPFIGGGKNNIANIDYSSVVGGKTNTASGTGSFIGGGFTNTASGQFTSIIGGSTNSASGVYSSILAGNNNTIKSTANSSSIIAGNSIIANSANTAHMAGLFIQSGATITIQTGGTNSSIGIVTLVAGEATINTTLVKSNSFIFLSNMGGTITNLGEHYVSAIVNGVSFTIKSVNLLDASKVCWQIIQTI